MTSTRTQPSIPVLTIDGLSGTGKTSISSQSALDLGWRALYSGLFYRYLAHCQLKGRFMVGADHTIGHIIQLELTNLTKQPPSLSQNQCREPKAQASQLCQLSSTMS